MRLLKAMSRLINNIKFTVVTFVLAVAVAITSRASANKHDDE